LYNINNIEEHKEPTKKNQNNYDNQRQPTVEGAYEPSQYMNLPVSAELK
jgi:hypothetical protein